VARDLLARQRIVTLVSIFVDHTSWGWKLLGGIVAVLAGIACSSIRSGAHC